MAKMLYLLLACLWLTSAFAAEIRSPPKTHAAKYQMPDSKQMEKDLQLLPWNRFRQVIESIPKLKADVEAYGPIGWSYVETKYRTHGWKKNIDKLNEVQRKQLADLIQAAKSAR